MDTRVAVTALLMILVNVLVLFWHFTKRPLSKKLINQLMFIISFLGVFFMCASFSKATISINKNWMQIWIVTIGFSWVGLAVLCWRVRSTKKRGIWDAVLSYKWEILVVGITLASRIWFVDTLQKWDSSEYYYSIMRIGERFDLSLSSFITAFRLLAHPTYGFAMWASIGEYITPQNVVGTLTVSVLLTCGANVCLFKLFREHWTKLSNGQAFMGVLICLLLPLYWAGNMCTMPDYFMALFIVFMIYSDFKQHNLLVIFWGVMAAFCKEIGFILVASFFAAKVFCCFFCGRASIKERFVRVFTNKAVYSGLCIGVVILCYLLIDRYLTKWTHSVYYNQPMSWASSGELLYNTFGFQADNISTRLKEYFIINFEWIFTSALIVALFYRGIRRCVRENKYHFTEFYATPIIETVAVLVAYGVFMCVYITACSIRYNVVFTLLFSALCYVVIAKTLNRRVLVVFTCVLCLLFGVQSCYSIDTITNKLFRVIDVGETTLLCISQKSHVNPGGDYYINNLQYRTLHENFEKMFRSVDWQEEDTMLIAGRDFAECQKNNSLVEFNGRHFDIKWDPDAQEIKNSINPEYISINTITTNALWGLNQIPSLDGINVTTQIQTYINGLTGRLFVYFSPVYQSDDNAVLISQLERVFELGEIKTVETKGNILSYCELTVKPEDEWVVSTITQPSTGNIQKKAWQHFYRSIRPWATAHDNSSKTIKAGDQIAVTIACYDVDGNFLNMETSPKGTILNQVVVGTGTNIDGFDEQVIGRNIGETIQVVVQIPKPYRYRPELEGQTVVMNVTVNGVINTLPEVTDSLIKTLFGYESVEMYYNAIYSSIAN